MRNIKISVIIPVYNVQNYISECIESLINQTFKDIEIILINDGSTDRTGEICRKYSENDNRILLIDKKNEGVSIARNIGLSMAKGEYIAFVDSDDFIDDNMLEIMYDKAIETKADIIRCNARILRGSSKNNILKETEVYSKLLDKVDFIEEIVKKDIVIGNNAMVVWGNLYKKDVIKLNKLKFKQICLEDYLFNMQYFKHVERYCLISNRLYNYRVLNNSLSRTFNVNIFNDLLFVENERQIFFKELNILDKENEILASKWFLKYIENIIYIINLYKNKLSRNEKYEYIYNIVTNHIVKKNISKLKDKNRMNLLEKLIYRERVFEIIILYSIKSKLYKVVNYFKCKLK